MKTSCITKRVVLGILIGLVFLGAYSAPVFGQFSIIYYDNYNYETEQWDGWQSATTPLDGWDDKYLAQNPHSEFTPHAFLSIDEFKLRGGLWSQDYPAPDPGGNHDVEGVRGLGQDWNPVRSIGDNASGQSPCHVFAALFTGGVYLVRGDKLELQSDDDAYVFLDERTAWGQEILSIDHISFFESIPPYVVPAELQGYHTVTVKFMERCNYHSGIQINLNGKPLKSMAVPPVEVAVDIKPGSCPNPLNVTDQGVLPVAILGTEGFDVTTVDPASVRLMGVAPIRSSYEDVATPVSDPQDQYACTTAGPDGYLDLTLKFDAHAIVAALGPAYDGDVITLTLMAETTGEALIVGTDCVIIIVPKAELVGHWKLDENKLYIASDSSPYKNDGLLCGDPVWQPKDGIIKGALTLDGTDDFVSLPIGSVISGLTNCTIATWVNWSGNEFDFWPRIFDFGSGTEVNMFLTPGLDTVGPMRFAITVGGAGAEEQVTAPDRLPSGWHHVCVTIDADAGVTTLYLDGSVLALNPTTSLTPSDLDVTINNWLGKSQYEADTYYNGMLDDFRIYDRALSSDEIEAVMGGK